MNLYIIRHGKTVWNEEGRFQGSMDSPLTEEGISQAEITNKLIKELDIDAVYSSPLGRTIQTKKLLTKDLDIPVHILDDLTEMSFGILEGKNIEKALEKHSDTMDKLWNDPKNYHSDGGESYNDLLERVKSALETITNSGYRNPLIVTHGMVIRAILSYIDGTEAADMWNRPVVRNTSLTTLKLVDGNLSIVESDNIDHLL